MRWLIPITDDESTNSIDTKTMATHQAFYRTPRCNIKSPEEKVYVTLDYIARHINAHLDKANHLQNGKPNSDVKYQLNLALGWLVHNAHQLPSEVTQMYQSEILRVHQSICPSLEEEKQFLDDHLIYAKILQNVKTIQDAKILQDAKKTDKSKNPIKKEYLIKSENIDCVLDLASKCLRECATKLYDKEKESHQPKASRNYSGLINRLRDVA
ncbi:MAG: hypothetical protein KAQ83_01440 [Nanoarchaeota archaeon]|nr:hypothetical protein [Nanoarchaeota archaeon]